MGRSVEETRLRSHPAGGQKKAKRLTLHKCARKIAHKSSREGRQEWYPLDKVVIMQLLKVGRVQNVPSVVSVVLHLE